MKIQVIIILGLIAVGCSDLSNKKASNKVENEFPMDTNNEKFQYRVIYNEIVDRNIWTIAFGNWELTSIANVGGTLSDEEDIQEQIGNQLIIGDYKIKMDFFEEQMELSNLTFDLESMSNKEGPKLKGSTYFNGYLTCRDSIYNLTISGKNKDENIESRTFELIKDNEIAYYSDGRIYFYTKVN